MPARCRKKAEMVSFFFLFFLSSLSVVLLLLCGKKRKKARGFLSLFTQKKNSAKKGEGGICN